MTANNERLRTACITVLGAGFAPFAPGTWGSAVAIVLFAPIWFGARAFAAPLFTVYLAVVAGILLASWLSVRWGGWAIARFGSSDPKPFTLDEFAGQWVALFVLPIALQADVWSWLCLMAGQFFFFRLFDVLKPPPARQAESLPAGWGILTDDLFAGLYANIAGQMLWRLTPLAAWLGVHLTS